MANDYDNRTKILLVDSQIKDHRLNPLKKEARIFVARDIPKAIAKLEACVKDPQLTPDLVAIDLNMPHRTVRGTPEYARHEPQIPAEIKAELYGGTTMQFHGGGLIVAAVARALYPKHSPRLFVYTNHHELDAGDIQIYQETAFRFLGIESFFHIGEREPYRRDNTLVQQLMNVLDFG